MAPAFDEVAGHFDSDPKIGIAKLDVPGGAQRIAKKYGVTGFPTLILFAEKEKVYYKYRGSRTSKDLIGFISGAYTSNVSLFTCKLYKNSLCLYSI